MLARWPHVRGASGNPRFGHEGKPRDVPMADEWGVGGQMACPVDELMPGSMFG